MDVFVAHLPGEILGHAVLDHLCKSRCSIDLEGPLHGFHNFLYISFVGNSTLEEADRVRIMSMHQHDDSLGKSFLTSTLKGPMWKPVQPSLTVSTSPPVVEHMGGCTKF